MSTQASRAWRAAGKPFTIARPVADLVKTLRGHGYTVGTIGNDDHLDARTPEDHTPFSFTGWPGAHPYPYVLALDIMPPQSGRLPNLALLGAQIVADRKSSFPGAVWIKYVNWTNAAGACRHESWKPNYAVNSSNDRGHIHISGRTDYVNSNVAATYDPVTRVLGQVAPAPAAGTVAAPTFRRALKYPPLMTGDDVRQWQMRMRERGWSIAVDGEFGPASADVARKFQIDKGLTVDGVVGPETWAASWQLPIT